MTFNEQVLALIATYPTDGYHQYHWVDGFDGVTQDLIYLGKTIAHSEAEKRTYCCGLTFEIWFKAMQLRYGKTWEWLLPSDLFKIKSEWFVATGGRKGPVDALVKRGFADEIKLANAKPGDFLQLWRTSGSGHSVIYLSQDAHSITYWSTQPSTNGIGKRTEKLFVPGGINETYLVRAK